MAKYKVLQPFRRAKIQFESGNPIEGNPANWDWLVKEGYLEKIEEDYPNKMISDKKTTKRGGKR